jgi:hypothetical protein
MTTKSNDDYCQHSVYETRDCTSYDDDDNEENDDADSGLHIRQEFGQNSDNEVHYDD